MSGVRPCCYPGAGSMLAMAVCIGTAATLMGTPSGWNPPVAWIWITLGFIGCALTLRWWKLDRLTTRTVLAGAIVFRLMLLTFPPLTSDDPFRYLWDGIIQHHGENPYRFLPSDPRFGELHGTPEFRRMNSPDYFSVYPPLSQAAFYLAASLRDHGFAASFVLLKFLFMLPEAAGLWALSKMVRPRDLMLYAWNPVVVLAVVGQGHTETAMIGFLLLALFAARSERPVAASFALAAAGSIKLYPFLLFLLFASRFGWRKMLPGIVAAGLLGWLYFPPDVLPNIGSSLALYLSRFQFYSGPFYALRELGSNVGVAVPDQWAARILAMIFAAVGISIWWLHRERKMPLETAVFAVIASYLACSRAVQVWYLAVLVSLLPLVPPPWRWPWLWLACLSWGTYLLHVDGTYWPFVWIGWSGWFAGMAIAFEGLRKQSRVAGFPL